ncbi:MAG: type IX secretion system membrane protein PorP/SprF [Chitinophagaceae bacterium]|nr:MAG: type IX secretion system membrane protein PorP/SprF [Chitinophagaceae bacterium]
MITVMKKKSFLLGVLLSGSLATMAQDINFSQFYEMPLLRNPALSGTFRGDLRVSGAFRSQWNSATSAYKTQALGVESKFGVSANTDDYMSFGMQLTNDVAGDSKMGKTQLLPVLTYHKSMSSEKDAYLSLGFIGGVVQQRFDPSGLKFDDQYVNGAYSPANPTRQTFSNTNLIYWDAGVGLAYSSEAGSDLKYYVGASYYHFNQPKVAFNPVSDVRLNSKFSMNAGLSVPTSEYDNLMVFGDLFMQGGHNQAQGGFLFRHDLRQLGDEGETVSLSAGAFYRLNDAVAPVIKLDYYQWSVGASYDATISKLKNANGGQGGFEITLSYKNFLNIRNSSADKMRCPVSF